MDKKISTILTIVVTIVSISVVLLGVGFATGLSSYYNSADDKQHVWIKYLTLFKED
jgi:hypothetical protein